jgi:hypothetical protein
MVDKSKAALSLRLHPRDRRACLPVSTPYIVLDASKIGKGFMHSK